MCVTPQSQAREDNGSDAEQQGWYPDQDYCGRREKGGRNATEVLGKVETMILINRICSK